MILIVAVLYYSVLYFIYQANGIIIRKSEDQQASIGDDVVFICTSDITVFDSEDLIGWYHTPVDSSQLPSELYKNGQYYDRCDEGRCSVSKNSSKSELFVKNVNIRDAGKFTCKDKESAVVETAELVVFESHPSFDSCQIKQSLQPSTQEVIWHLTCSMSYKGNLIPNMEWQQIGGDNVPSNDSTVDRITTSSICVTTEQFTTCSFMCRARYKTSNLTSKYNWSTGNEHHRQQSASSSVDADQSKLTGGSIAAIVLALVLILLIIFGLWYIFQLERKLGNQQRLQNIDIDLNEIDQQRPLLNNKNDGTIDEISLRLTRNDHRIVVDADAQVIGMVEYDDIIYVVYLNIKRLSVFDNVPPFNKAGDDMEIEEVEEPRIIDACKVSKCLYISDASAKCIWKLPEEEARQGHPTLKKWLTDLSLPYRLSVMSDGRLLVPSMPSLMLAIYNADSILNCQIKLDSLLLDLKNILEPVRAVETTTGSIILSCGGQYSDGHVVLAIDIRYDPPLITWRYGNQKGNRSDQLDNPHHFAMDEKGRIYIGDQLNGRVVVLNRNGKQLLTVTTEAPYRLCYLRKSRNLLVGFNPVRCYSVEEVRCSCSCHVGRPYDRYS